MHVAMIGSGYVGLVSGACLADFGHNVICVDKDPEKISALKRGESPIFEPGLDDLVKRNMREGRLSFTSEVASPVAAAQAVFIAVGTPSRRGCARMALLTGRLMRCWPGRALRRASVIPTCM